MWGPKQEKVSARVYVCEVCVLDFIKLFILIKRVKL